MTNAEYQKNLRQTRKSQGLCTRCGSVLEKDNSTTTCRVCKDYDKNYKAEQRTFFKQIGLCPYCGKYELLNDEKMCLECRANCANTSYIRTQNEDVKAKMREYKMSVKEHRINNHLCTACGNPNDTDGHTCSLCRKKERIRYRKRFGCKDGSQHKSVIWKKQGLCALCGSECKEGYKVCDKHYEQMIYVTHHPNTVKSRKEFKGQW